jgi:hypothetical protein
MNTKTIKKTFEQTTQYARMPHGTILKKHYKSPFPALNVQRRDEPVATDTVYSSTPAIDGGETCAKIFVGTEILVTDVYDMKTEKQFFNTLEDNIHKRGALSRLLSDRAKVEISAHVVGIFRALHTGQWQSEPHQQHQNPCKRYYQTLKTMTGSPWLIFLMYVAVLLKLTYNWTLGCIPLQCAEGSTRDKSLTALHRSNLCSAKKPSNPNLCLDPPLDGENLPQSPQIVKSVQDDAEDVSDQVKPIIYFDTGDLVGQTFLMEEDDDGLLCRARIFEVLDDHEKNVTNSPVLKKFKCLVGEDKFDEIISYNEVMQHIEKDNDDGDNFWKCKRISGHEAL